MATDTVLIIATIGAKEESNVVTMILPGVYLHTENDEHVVMLLKGKLCKLVVQIDPKLYRKYVTTNSKREPMLYMKLYKALNGLLRSAFLLYRKLRGEPKEMGFKVNPCDMCITNKVVNRSQMIVCRHNDDLKVSHKDPNEVTKFINRNGDIRFLAGKK